MTYPELPDEGSNDESLPPHPPFRLQRSPRRNAPLQEGDETALKEFFLYFQPVLLEHARFMGIDPALRKEIVITFLDDKVVELASMDVPPRSLTGYVIRAFRNRIRNEIRDRKTRERIYEEAASQLMVAEERPEYRTEFSDHDELLDISLPIARLARIAQQELTAEDAQLLIESSQRIPLREIAAWHGMNYGACRVRLHRLRIRAAQLMRDYLRNLPSNEKQMMEKFLRRSGALEE
jgi:DNA-directed RNA polymerase specialized sigma24 family protein